MQGYIGGDLFGQNLFGPREGRESAARVKCVDLVEWQGETAQI